MTPKPDSQQSPEGVWLTPTVTVKLPDGSWLFKTGKPIFRANARQTAKLTGLSLKTLRILADMGLIRNAKASRSLVFYYPAEIEEFLAETGKDPDFWNEARESEYIKHARKRWGKTPGNETA